MHIRVDGVIGGPAIANRDQRPPLGKARTHLVILGETGTEPVQALGFDGGGRLPRNKNPDQFTLF
jgi:hypothetical protein